MKMFPIMMIFTLIIARTLTSYDSRTNKGKFIVINNSTLAKILIEKEDFYERRKVQKKDRNKMSFMGFILYIANIVLILLTIILACAPKIPCEPYELDSAKMYLHADTWNMKIIIISSMILLCAEFICIAVSMFKENKRIEGKFAKVLVQATAIFLILISVAIIIVMLFDLF